MYLRKHLDSLLNMTKTLRFIFTYNYLSLFIKHVHNNPSTVRCYCDKRPRTSPVDKTLQRQRDCSNDLKVLSKCRIKSTVLHARQLPHRIMQCSKSNIGRHNIPFTFVTNCQDIDQRKTKVSHAFGYHVKKHGIFTQVEFLQFFVHTQVK